jgi:hypothetical protein
VLQASKGTSVGGAAEIVLQLAAVQRKLKDLLSELLAVPPL